MVVSTGVVGSSAHFAADADGPEPRSKPHIVGGSGARSPKAAGVPASANPPASALTSEGAALHVCASSASASASGLFQNLHGRFRSTWNRRKYVVFVSSARISCS